MCVCVHNKRQGIQTLQVSNMEGFFFYGRPEHSPNSVTICGNIKSRPHACALEKAIAKDQDVPVLAFGDDSVCMPHISLGLKIHSLLSSSNSIISLCGTGPCCRQVSLVSEKAEPA